MPTTSRLRRWMTFPVIVFGALTTIATSAVQPVQLSTDRALSLEPGAAVYVQVVLDEVAMDHARHYGGSIAVEVSGEDVRVVPDDAAFPPEEGGWIRLYTGVDACPESGACTLGYTIESTGESEHVVRVTASAQVEADTSFLFPENRDFPAEAEVRIAVDGE